MNLLHITPSYPPLVGGAGQHLHEISARLVRAGHRVTVVTTNAAEAEYFWHPAKQAIPRAHDELNDVQIVRCPVAHLPLSPYSFYALRRVAIELSRIPSSLPALRYIARYMPHLPNMAQTLAALPEAFDLVLGVNIATEYPLMLAGEYARQRGLPFVTLPLVHVGEPRNPHVLRYYTMRHQIDALRHSDKIILNTAIEGQVLARFGIPPARMVAIGPGVNLDHHRGGDAARFRAKYELSSPIVAFLGTVTFDKGAVHLVQALQQLWAAGSDLTLVLAGTPVDEFKHFYAKMPERTQARAKLLGRISDQDKLDLLAALDVLVLPSRVDSFGMVFLEAWANRKPVIGARAGGIPAVIADDQDGLLVDFGDVPALAEAIRNLTARPEYAARLGARGYEKVCNQYTWDIVYDKFRRVYEEVLNA